MGSRSENIVLQFPTYLVSSLLQTMASQGLAGAGKVPFPDFLSHSIRVFIYKSKFLFKLDAARAISPPFSQSRASNRFLLMKHFPQQEKGQTRAAGGHQTCGEMLLSWAVLTESQAPAALTSPFPFMCRLVLCQWLKEVKIIGACTHWSADLWFRKAAMTSAALFNFLKRNEHKHYASGSCTIVSAKAIKWLHINETSWFTKHHAIKKTAIGKRSTTSNQQRTFRNTTPKSLVR